MTRRTLALALLLVGSSIATPSGAPVIPPGGTSETRMLTSATPTGTGRTLRSAPHGAEAPSLPLAAPAVSELIGSVAASPTARQDLARASRSLPDGRNRSGWHLVAASHSGGVSEALVGGWATWQDNGPGLYAAAGPALRSLLGPGWRGTIVEVGGPGGASVIVVLSDFCACGDRRGKPTLLDLSREAFSELAHPSVGIVAVSIELPAQLPSTDMEDPR